MGKRKGENLVTTLVKRGNKQFTAGDLGFKEIGVIVETCRERL